MRVRIGKIAVIVDKSMMTKAEIRTLGKDEHVVVDMEDHGLNDVSDLKNEDFIYVY